MPRTMPGTVLRTVSQSVLRTASKSVLRTASKSVLRTASKSVLRTVLTGSLVVAALAACTGPAAEQPGEASPPPGLSVSLAQWRADEADHQVSVAVRNDSATPVHFARVRLVTESFRTLPPHPVGTTLGRTPRTDLRIPYGEAVCPSDRIPPVRPAAIVADLRVGDGPERRVRFPLPHPDPLLTRLVREECGAQLLRRRIDIAFGESWTRVRTSGRDALRGVLRIERRSGNEAIEIVELGATTNFALLAASGRSRPVAVLPAGTPRLELAVLVTPARCDPHAFAEAKKAHLFPIRAAAGGGDPLWLVASPPPHVRTLFTEHARQACGLPGA
ncbi:hypothetical protein [Thermopolyspora flexuosa]|nr:hypothetical protein [Thermopolyspora flexuosa]